MLNDNSHYESDASVAGSRTVRTWRRPAGMLTAAELERMKFDPLQWIVPGLLPEGLALIAAPPKAGKSYLALGMAIAVASGGKAFGTVDCEAGDVLYLALEDGHRRLQARIRQLLPFDGFPERLCFAVNAPRIGQGLVERIEDWLGAVPNPRLIILDTWRTVKPEASGRGSAYDEDASGIAPIHELTKAHPGLCVLIIHHTRKMESDDAFATVSGTYGLTGVADTLLVLARHGDGHKLCIRGREVEDAEKALQRDRHTGGWKLNGDAREIAKTTERQQILDVLAEAEGEALRTSQLAKATGMSESNASHRLKKLIDEGLVERAGYGKWRLHTPYQSSQSDQSSWTGRDHDHSDFDNFDHFDGGEDE